MKELPKDLSGYQWVKEGLTQEGDIYHTDDYIFWANVGVPVSDYIGFGAIYRKIPVAKQGDNDASWKDVQAKAEASKAEPSKALTYDDGKPPLAYLPWAALDEVAMVQAYGHQKYGDFYNYRKGMEVGRSLSCAIRHIRAYMEGEDDDPESGRNHLAHAATRLLFTLQNIADGKQIDDRHNKQAK
jgi:hypothetical protein